MQGNAKFAVAIDGGNQKLRQRKEAIDTLRQQVRPQSQTAHMSMSYVAGMSFSRSSLLEPPYWRCQDASPKGGSSRSTTC